MYVQLQCLRIRPVAARIRPVLEPDIPVIADELVAVPVPDVNAGALHEGCASSGTAGGSHQVALDG